MLWIIFIQTWMLVTRGPYLSALEIRSL